MLHKIYKKLNDDEEVVVSSEGIAGTGTNLTTSQIANINSIDGLSTTVSGLSTSITNIPSLPLVDAGNNNKILSNDGTSVIWKDTNYKSISDGSYYNSDGKKLITQGSFGGGFANVTGLQGGSMGNALGLNGGTSWNTENYTNLQDSSVDIKLSHLDGNLNQVTIGTGGSDSTNDSLGEAVHSTTLNALFDNNVKDGNNCNSLAISTVNAGYHNANGNFLQLSSNRRIALTIDLQSEILLTGYLFWTRIYAHQPRPKKWLLRATNTHNTDPDLTVWTTLHNVSNSGQFTGNGGATAPDDLHGVGIKPTATQLNGSTHSEATNLMNNGSVNTTAFRYIQFVFEESRPGVDANGNNLTDYTQTGLSMGEIKLFSGSHSPATPPIISTTTLPTDNTRIYKDALFITSTPSTPYTDWVTDDYIEHQVLTSGDISNSNEITHTAGVMVVDTSKIMTNNLGLWKISVNVSSDTSIVINNRNYTFVSSSTRTEQNFYLANDVLNVRYDMDESDTGHRCDFEFYQLIPNQDLTIDNV
jgi:hypothetical protein